MSSRRAGPGSRLVSSDHVRVVPHALASPVALLSMDVETDYGTGRTEALDELARFLDVLDELALPLTAFVEGQLFERRPRVCALLADRGVDVQLHVYDHSTSGDSPDSLEQGVAAFTAFMGRPPDGYRAHTCRLTPGLFDALVSLGFTWDSSVMRAFALGHNGHACFREGDYFTMGDSLLEFPVGRWRGVNLPLNHPYSLLTGRVGSQVLRQVFGPADGLVAYNIHMTDLLRVPALDAAPYGALFRLLQHWMWLGNGGDTFAFFRQMMGDLRDRGYTFETTNGLYRRLAAARPD
jgi:peptidoglycan/xylan/chitin deacetylase (PgdA/CDA1 family)